MKDYETLISDIRREEIELNEKLGRLERFMMTEDFCTLSAEQQKLLNRQRVCMTEYKSILMQRSYRINFEHAQDKEKTCATETEKVDRIEPQEHAIPSDCVNCRWGERIIENERVTCICRNPDKTINRDKCFESRKY